MRTTPKRPNKPRRTVASLDELPAICDVCDVAIYLKINPENVAKLARNGVINGAKIGQSWRFRKSDIIDYETRLFGCGKQSGEAS
ncbi:helix-turn-helix domain-containing protein [Lawsonibacter sp. JLR.KK007]|jgi:excisionase family DNA binding protein|uniref:helix-turn-helix domain-containing protein n=1 Tax=Lawsonibacter sp. JLR.KK007 TaxID=3114293 RepID=UPI002FF349A7